MPLEAEGRRTVKEEDDSDDEQNPRIYMYVSRPPFISSLYSSFAS